MKLAEAIAIGKDCGLAEPAEAVNNIILHLESLFPYDKTAAELAELVAEARAAGIAFCPKCGSAQIDSTCYMCRNVNSSEVLLGHRGGTSFE